MGGLEGKAMVGQIGLSIVQEPFLFKIWDSDRESAAGGGGGGMRGTHLVVVRRCLALGRHRLRPNRVSSSSGDGHR